jgi:hypothetical protein
MNSWMKFNKLLDDPQYSLYGHAGDDDCPSKDELNGKTLTKGLFNKMSKEKTLNRISMETGISKSRFIVVCNPSRGWNYNAWIFIKGDT